MSNQVENKISKKQMQRGAALVEYALLVVLTALIGVVSIRAVGVQVGMVTLHAQAGLAWQAAGAAGIQPAWCLFGTNSLDPICN